LDCFDTDIDTNTSSYAEHGRILGNSAAIKLSGPVGNMTPAVRKKRRSVGQRDEWEGKARGERVIAHRFTTQQWSLSSAQIR